MTTETFEENRAMLFGIAYRMLGSVADAEDIVQEAWLRWHDVEDPVGNPRGYLAKTVTNLAINRMRSVAVRREAYVGPWLPEPLIAEPDAGERVELAESVSMAMLVVLETLSPLERAVFVLKDVFGFPFREIAEGLDRSEESVRQVAHRARAHVRARRPRFDASDETRQRVTEEFLEACMGGDINAMMAMLAPDVTAWTDGGGRMRAALRPLHGSDKIARFIVGVLGNLDDPTPSLARVNGQPGVLVHVDGRLDSVGVLDVTDGKITAIYLIRNPDKLGHIAPP